MAKMTVAKAKKQIIAQIKKRGGLFENVGQKEIMQLREQELMLDDYQERMQAIQETNELSQWVDHLDYNSVKQIL
jgi:hypothetical protein